METAKIFISNKGSPSQENCKYIIDYKDNYKIRQMCIILSEMKGTQKILTALYVCLFDKR